MTKRFIAPLLVPLLALPLALSSAHAQDNFSLPAVKISGFGTLAATQTSSDAAQFVRPNQSSGATHTARTGVDSNFGVQANTELNSWLSATAQGLVRKDAEDDFGAELAWAFLKAKVNDKLSLRVGRMGMPVFLISDYRNVGYANTMLRPPAEVYTQVLLGNIDGIDATWQQSLGDTNVSALLAFGRIHKPIAASNATVHLDGTSLVALNLVAEHGPFTLRFGRVDGKLTLNDSPTLNALLAGLRASGAGYQLAPLADALAVNKKKASFTSVGLALDWNNIVLQSEYARRKTDSYINNTNSWYTMAGYRIGKFLPYYNHAETKSTGHVANTVPSVCPAGSPLACAATVRVLSAGVDTLSAAQNQSTDTIGVRWDLYRSMALKVQIDRVRPKDGAGLLIKAQPGFEGPITVGAVALDFVF
ncbi:hypothetical protein [Massilia sp. DWR3-1-1]|uniref:hypothetical protein n=1 Tax=Massilia sp. DWR3-1-1 TaxID=2804559 RepID=UPI003CEAA0A5